MKSNLISNFFIITAFLFISCTGDQITFLDANNFEVISEGPQSAILVFPENNKECTEGSIVNKDKSNVPFKWNISENTDLYELTVQNLNTNITSKIEVQTNEAGLVLERGVTYKWHVTSKNNAENTEVATSEIWQFYNAGEGIINHIPFPAKAIYPDIATQLNKTTTSVKLEWIASDIDNDITEYKLLFDTVNPPITSLGIVTMPAKEVLVTSGNTYFWKIATKDTKGNTSNSDVFWFKTE